MEGIERGVSVKDAFPRTLTDEERTELHKYEAYKDPVPFWIPGAPPNPYEALHEKYQKIFESCQERFIGMLRSGKLGATAMEVPATLNSRRTAVPAHLWDVLELDFDKSEASGAGLKLVDIRVIATPHVSNDASSAASGNSPPQPISSSEERVRCLDEGRILMIDDHVMLFGGNAQKSIIVQLVEGHREKKPTRGLELLRKAGSNSKSIEKLFKDNPHWDLLSSYLRRERGFYWLELKSL